MPSLHHQVQDPAWHVNRSFQGLSVQKRRHAGVGLGELDGVGFGESDRHELVPAVLAIHLKDQLDLVGDEF